jgi:hypothetical protein
MCPLFGYENRAAGLSRGLVCLPTFSEGSCFSTLLNRLLMTRLKHYAIFCQDEKSVEWFPALSQARGILPQPSSASFDRDKELLPALRLASSVTPVK